MGRDFSLWAATLLLGLVFLAVWVRPAASQWRVVPEVRVAGGDESDLVIDPGLTRTVIPGGSFVEISPAVALRGWAGRRALVDVGTFASLQRFFNSESRFLYAQTVWGNVYQSLGANFRGRLSASVDYFDDSERDTVRRFGGGGELGLTFARTRWSTEVWGGARGRRYPNLDVLDGQNRTSTYAEATWTGGATLRATPSERIDLRFDGTLQRTDSRDSYYNSVSSTGFGSADIRVVSSVFMTLSGTYQTRDFTERETGEDTDRYWQIGAGLRYTVATGWTASIRYGYSDYTWPDGNSHESHRLAVGFDYVWGRRSAPPRSVDVPMLTETSGGALQQADSAGNVTLRVKAAEALTVAVAGDFNDWDPEANPLDRDGDGWWVAHLSLEPGSYEYVYVIDGEWVTPPESTLTADDGFGGRNGILEVLPPGL